MKFRDVQFRWVGIYLAQRVCQKEDPFVAVMELAAGDRYRANESLPRTGRESRSSVILAMHSFYRAILSVDLRREPNTCEGAGAGLYAELQKGLPRPVPVALCELVPGHPGCVMWLIRKTHRSAQG